ncbi:MAG: chromosomal replication initiator protein DnaA [Lachnospiraceae bacterium]|nr:chromosomal replication initiator protein DnaA [Lachnospiraceae bacterium]
MNTNQSPENFIRNSWPAIKEHIRDEYRLSEISYTTWILNLILDSVKDNVVTICIPSDQSFSLSYIAGKFTDYFRITITEMMNEPYSVRFILEKDAEAAEDVPVARPSNVMFENAGLISRYRFDTFVVGSNNKFAQSAALAVSESPGEAYNPLFLYGGAGLGKTHLMHSIGHYVLEKNPDLKVIYVTAEQFTNEVIESIRSGSQQSMSRLRDKYRTVDILLIDDIQFIIGKDATQEEFFHTFNELHAAGKQIVLSSDRPPKEIQPLDERYRSRFEWGLIADIQPPDYETRMAILRKNAEGSGLVDDEILDYIAQNIQSNIRELEGALRKIIAHSKLNNVDITLDSAREALKDIITPGGAGTITPSLIAKTVCDHYGVKMTNVISKKKNAELVLPRQIIMYLCREYCDMTYDAVAKLLGKKDHSTVIHGVDKITEEMQSSEELKNNIEIIIRKLNINA